jgi:hypothetical protein
MSILVNDAEIRDAEIGREMQYHPAGSREDAWYLAAQSLVVRQLLLQRATEAGLCETPEAITAGKVEEEIIDQLLQIDVNVPEADEKTCRRYYQTHSGRFVDRNSGKTLPFERTHALIRDYLHTKAMRVAVAEYIRALSNTAAIRGLDLTG